MDGAFRKREDLTVLGAAFGISRATAYHSPARSRHEAQQAQRGAKSDRSR
jgi:hypothetical protein